LLLEAYEEGGEEFELPGEMLMKTQQKMRNQLHLNFSAPTHASTDFNWSEVESGLKLCVAELALAED